MLSFCVKRENACKSLIQLRFSVDLRPVGRPTITGVPGAVQPVSRHFVTLPQCPEPLEVCAVDPLPAT